MAETQYRSTKASATVKNRHHGGFSSKCASLIKQQRARLYIVRRCATMLLRSYIEGDD